MKVVLVQPLRLSYYMDRIYREFQIDDVPEPIDILSAVFRKEMEKPVEEMHPAFLDLLELLLDTLSSYGVKLDFFSVAGLEAIDECKSLMIKVM